MSLMVCSPRWMGLSRVTVFGVMVCSFGQYVVAGGMAARMMRVD